MTRIWSCFAGDGRDRGRQITGVGVSGNLITGTGTQGTHWGHTATDWDDLTDMFGTPVDCPLTIAVGLRTQGKVGKALSCRAAHFKHRTLT